MIWLLIVPVTFVALTAYSCCRMASIADDQMESMMQEGGPNG